MSKLDLLLTSAPPQPVVVVSPTLEVERLPDFSENAIQSMAGMLPSLFPIREDLYTSKYLAPHGFHPGLSQTQSSSSSSTQTTALSTTLSSESHHVLSLSLMTRLMTVDRCGPLCVFPSADDISTRLYALTSTDYTVATPSLCLPPSWTRAPLPLPHRAPLLGALVLALTPASMLCGFYEIADVARYVDYVPELAHIIGPTLCELLRRVAQSTDPKSAVAKRVLHRIFARVLHTEAAAPHVCRALFRSAVARIVQQAPPALRQSILYSSGSTEGGFKAPTTATSDQPTSSTSISSSSSSSSSSSNFPFMRQQLALLCAISMGLDEEQAKQQQQQQQQQQLQQEDELKTLGPSTSSTATSLASLSLFSPFLLTLTSLRPSRSVFIPPGAPFALVRGQISMTHSSALASAPISLGPCSLLPDPLLADSLADSPAAGSPLFRDDSATSAEVGAALDVEPEIVAAEGRARLGVEMQKQQQQQQRQQDQPQQQLSFSQIPCNRVRPHAALATRLAALLACTQVSDSSLLVSSLGSAQQYAPQGRLLNSLVRVHAPPAAFWHAELSLLRMPGLHTAPIAVPPPPTKVATGPSLDPTSSSISAEGVRTKRSLSVGHLAVAARPGARPASSSHSASSSSGLTSSMSFSSSGRLASTLGRPVLGSVPTTSTTTTSSPVVSAAASRGRSATTAPSSLPSSTSSSFARSSSRPIVSAGLSSPIAGLTEVVEGEDEDTASIVAAPAGPSTASLGAKVSRAPAPGRSAATGLLDLGGGGEDAEAEAEVPTPTSALHSGGSMDDVDDYGHDGDEHEHEHDYAAMPSHGVATRGRRASASWGGLTETVTEWAYWGWDLITGATSKAVDAAACLNIFGRTKASDVYAHTTEFDEDDDDDNIAGKDSELDALMREAERRRIENPYCGHAVLRPVSYHSLVQVLEGDAVLTMCRVDEATGKRLASITDALKDSPDMTETAFGASSASASAEHADSTASTSTSTSTSSSATLEPSYSRSQLPANDSLLSVPEKEVEEEEDGEDEGDHDDELSSMLSSVVASTLKTDSSSSATNRASDSRHARHSVARSAADTHSTVSFSTSGSSADASSSQRTLSSAAPGFADTPYSLNVAAGDVVLVPPGFAIFVDATIPEPSVPSPAPVPQGSGLPTLALSPSSGSNHASRGGPASPIGADATATATSPSHTLAAVAKAPLHVRLEDDPEEEAFARTPSASPDASRTHHLRYRDGASINGARESFLTASPHPDDTSRQLVLQKAPSLSELSSLSAVTPSRSRVSGYAPPRVVSKPFSCIRVAAVSSPAPGPEPWPLCPVAWSHVAEDHNASLMRPFSADHSSSLARYLSSTPCFRQLPAPSLAHPAQPYAPASSARLGLSDSSMHASTLVASSSSVTGSGASHESVSASSGPFVFSPQAPPLLVHVVQAIAMGPPLDSVFTPSTPSASLSSVITSLQPFRNVLLPRAVSGAPLFPQVVPLDLVHNVRVWELSQRTNSLTRLRKTLFETSSEGAAGQDASSLSFDLLSTAATAAAIVESLTEGWPGVSRVWKALQSQMLARSFAKFAETYCIQLEQAVRNHSVSSAAATPGASSDESKTKPLALGELVDTIHRPLQNATILLQESVSILFDVPFVGSGVPPPLPSSPHQQQQQLASTLDQSTLLSAWREVTSLRTLPAAAHPAFKRAALSPAVLTRIQGYLRPIADFAPGFDVTPSVTQPSLCSILPLVLVPWTWAASIAWADPVLTAGPMDGDATTSGGAASVSSSKAGGAAAGGGAKGVAPSTIAASSCILLGGTWRRVAEAYAVAAAYIQQSNPSNVMIVNSSAETATTTSTSTLSSQPLSPASLIAQQRAFEGYALNAFRVAYFLAGGSSGKTETVLASTAAAQVQQLAASAAAATTRGNAPA